MSGNLEKETREETELNELQAMLLVLIIIFVHCPSSST